MKPTAQLKGDLDNLIILWKYYFPKRVPVVLKVAGCFHYDIGGASDDGYGAAIHIGQYLHFRYE